MANPTITLPVDFTSTIVQCAMRLRSLMALSGLPEDAALTPEMTTQLTPVILALENGQLIICRRRGSQCEFQIVSREEAKGK